MTSNTNTYETTDLALASYINGVKAHPLQSYRSDRRDGRAVTVFVFEDHPKCQQLAVEYQNSESAIFDSGLRRLKKIHAEVSQPKNGNPRAHHPSSR